MLILDPSVTESFPLKATDKAKNPDCCIKLEIFSKPVNLMLHKQIKWYGARAGTQRGRFSKVQRVERGT